MRGLISAPKAFFGPKKHDPELGVGHAPLSADGIFFAAFQIKGTQDGAVAFRQFVQTVIDGVAHLEDFGLGADAGIGNRHLGVGEGFPALPAAVFEDHVTAHTVDKCPEFLGVANLPALFSAEKAREGFLHQVVDIGAVVAQVIKNFIAQLEAEALDEGLGQGFGGLF